MSEKHKTVRMVIEEADVDEGIAPVVKWLNGVYGVTTMHSCQGGDKADDGTPIDAYVVFSCQYPTSLMIILGEIEQWDIRCEIEWYSLGNMVRYNMVFNGTETLDVFCQYLGDIDADERAETDENK